MTFPYQKSDTRKWWNFGVAQVEPESVRDLYRKRFDISETDRISTAGSCFAQHIARHMRRCGYQIFDAETAPFGMSSASAMKFGYGIYSCRYGNIYHVRQFRQLVREALSNKMRDDSVWSFKGRYYDALRPTVEPRGLSSPDEVRAQRVDHLRAVRRMLTRANVFVFTLGLTEAWVNTESGVVYPSFPGAFGNYSPDKHTFRNFKVSEVVADFLEARRLIHSVNPKMKFILTVSPVPLIATASDSHVLVATTASKSILRAAAQEIYNSCDDVDYFPSYEIISSPWSKGRFFEDDLRNVTEHGVNVVMRSFFEQHTPFSGAEPIQADGEDELVCDEVLLEAFQK